MAWAPFPPPPTPGPFRGPPPWVPSPGPHLNPLFRIPALCPALNQIPQCPPPPTWFHTVRLAWMDTQYLVPFTPFSERGPAPRIAPEGPLPHTRAPVGASALRPRSPTQHFPNVGLACRSTLDATVPRDKNDVGTRAGRRRRSCSGHLLATGFRGTQPPKFY